MSLDLVVDNAAAVDMPLPPVEIVRMKMGALGPEVRDFGVALQGELNKLAETGIAQPEEIPLAVYDATKKAVTVYTNIVLPRADIVNGVLSAKYLDLFSVKFYNEIATDIFAKKWDNPETSLNRHEVTTVARFLTKLLPKNTAADFIRDMAQRLEDYFLPPELIFTKEPKDWIEMYTCNASSCMRVGNFQYIKADPGEAALKAGVWPSMYNAYWPNATGVYIKKAGTVVARATLFKKDPKDDKYIGYALPYGVTDAFKAALTKELNKLCPVLTYLAAPFTTVFTGPVHTIAGRNYAIHCSCDFIANTSVYMCYDKVNNCVMYGPHAIMPRGSKNISEYGFSNNGFILIEKLFQYDSTCNKQAAA